VTDHGDQLREAFQTHERLAPDAAEVYARVRELSRTYRRRRLGGQVAGGAVLGAGLIAGVINLPAVLPADPAADKPAAVAGAQLPAPSPSAGVGPDGRPAPGMPDPSRPVADPELQKRWDAYFQAGYDYDDAVRLAQLWQSSAGIGMVKAEAGRRLLAGETLPFPATPDTPSGQEPVEDSAEQKQIQAFFFAGYTYDEAVKLADLWKLPDASAAKVMAGKKLLAGEKLPVKPTAAGVKAGLEAKRVDKFFAAGYDYEDALKLAKLWKTKDAYSAKVEGGRRLLAGRPLPIKP
jgi:hypothetical protein